MATNEDYFSKYLEEEANTNRFQELVENSTFNDVVEKKRIELGLASEEKQENLFNLTNEFQTFDVELGDNYDADTLNQFGRLYGGGKGYSIDAYETAKYDTDGNLIPYLGSVAPTDGSKRSKKWNLHRASYSKRYGIPAEMVSQRMLNEEAVIQAENFKNLLMKGQDPDSDTISLDIRQDAQGFFGRPLITVRNPKTGEIINEVMNTPENNAMFYSKYNRDTYEDGVQELNALESSVNERTGKGFWDSAGKGLSSGIDNLQATGYGFMAVIADATGNADKANWFLKNYLRNIEEAQKNGANLPRVEDVDWSDPTAVLSKLGALIGEAMPSIALMFGTGGFGGFLAKAAVKGKVKSYVGKGLSDDALKLLGKAQGIGRATGAYGGAMGMETGSIYGDVAVEGNRDNKAIYGSLAGGTIAGALEAFYPIKLMKKFGLNKARVNKATENSILRNNLSDNFKSIGKGLLSGGAQEGTTELLQFVVEEITQDLIKEGHLPAFNSAEFKSGLLNSFVAGLVPGSVLGGGANVISETVNRVRGDQGATQQEVDRVKQEAATATNQEAVGDPDLESVEDVANNINTVENNASNLGVDLENEVYQGFKTNEEKASYILDELSNLEINQKALPKAERKTEVIEARKKLEKALKNLNTGNAAVKRRAQLQAARIKFERKTKGKNKDTKVYKDALLEYNTALKVLYGKAKRYEQKGAEVLKKQINADIKKINSINEQLKDPNLSKAKIKNLKRLRNQLGVKIDKLSKDSEGTKLPALPKETFASIDKTLNSFNFKNRKSTIREDTTVQEDLKDIVEDSEETGTPKLERVGAKTIKVLENPKATTKERADAIDSFIKLYRKAENIVSKIEKQLESVTDKNERKALKTALKDIQQRIDNVSKAVEVIQKQEKVETEVLYSLKPLTEKQINDFKKLKNLSKTEQALLDAHIAVYKAKEDVDKNNKDIEDVRNDVLLGDEKAFQGFMHYLKLAQKNTSAAANNIQEFLIVLQDKLNRFEDAQKMLADKKLKTVWINKNDYQQPILTTMPTVEKNGKQVEDKDNYFFVNAKSNRLMQSIREEIAFGKAVLNLITKATNQKTKKEKEALNKAINEAKQSQAKKPVTNKDLDEIKTEDVKIDKKDKPFSKEELIKLFDAIKPLKDKAREINESWMDTVDDPNIDSEVFYAENVLPAKIAVLEAQIKHEEALNQNKPNKTWEKSIADNKTKIKKFEQEIAEILEDSKKQSAATESDSKSKVIHVLNKFKNSFVKIRNSKFTAADIFRIAQPKRDSIYSRSKGKNITDVTAILNEMGIEDKEFIAYLDKYFVEFKNNYEKFLLKKPKQDENTGEVFTTTHLINMLLIEENGVKKLPDDILFAMMLSTLDWMSINKYNSNVTDDQTIALYLYNDRKADLTREDILEFGDMGIRWSKASEEIGADIWNSLNVKVNSNEFKGLNLNELIKKYQELQNDNNNGVLRDDSLVEQLQIALGQEALAIAGTVHPKADKKSDFDGLIQLTYGIFHHPTFENDKNPKKDKKLGWEREIKVIKFPYLNETKVPFDLENLFESFRKNKKSIEIINGTSSTRMDTLASASKSVQKFVKKSVIPLPVRTFKLIQKLQNVEWSGKAEALSLFELVDSDEVTMSRLIELVNLEEQHEELKDGYKNANDDKLKDVELVRTYLKEGSKPYWFRYKAQKQNRLRIDSNGINGQRSKIHRALFMPKSAEVTIATEFQRATYQLAIAQAFGFDIDKNDLKTSLLFFDEVYEKSQSIRDYIKSGNKSSKQFNKLLNEFLDIKDKDGNTLVKPSMHVLEALASLNNYSATKSFKSASLGIETDGITNGYAIALMQFLGVPEGTNDENVANVLADSMARIGVMVGTNDDGSPKTMENFIQDKQLDVYEALADFIRLDLQDAKILDTINKDATKEESINFDQLDALNLVHGELYDNIKEKISSFGRSLAKNPLMISGYGAELARIVNALSSDVIPSIYKELASFQVKYDKATAKEKAGILEDFNKYAKAIDAFIPNSSKRLILSIKKGKLKKFTFRPSQVINVQKTFTKIFTPPITSALNQFTVPLKAARDAIIRSGELQYTAFKYKYDEAIDKFKDSQNPKVTKVPYAVKQTIAQELALKHMPLIYGPWSDKSAPLQIINDIASSVQDEGRIDTTFKEKQLRDAIKEGNKFTQVRNKPRKSVVSNTFSRDYAAPSVSMYSNTIQNIDSVILGEALEKNPEVLAIFDALMSNTNDAYQNNENYNESFREVSRDFSVLQNALDRLTESQIALTPAERNKVEEKYREKSFEADKIKQEEKDPAKQNALLNNLGFGKVIQELNDEITRIDKHKELLANEFGKDWLNNATVSQMYLPESLKLIKEGSETIDSIKDSEGLSRDKATLYSLDNDLDIEMKALWDTDSLSKTAQNIFNKLGDHFKTYYPTNEEQATQESHLQRVLNEIILPTGNALDDVSIELFGADIKAFGAVNLENKNISVVLNNKKPKSFSEQTAQEAYIHELIHIITNSPLAKNSSFRNDIERIRNSVEKELEKMDRPYEIFLHKDSDGNIITLTDEKLEIESAKEQYNYLFGPNKSEFVLDEFLAYALTNKHLVRELSNMQANVVPLWNKESDANVIEKTIDFFTELVKRFVNIMQKKPVSGTLDKQIFQLTKDMVNASHSQAGKVRGILQRQNLVKDYDKANEAASDFLKDIVTRGVKFGSDQYIKGVDKLTKDGKINNFFANVLYDSKLAVLMTSSYGKFINDNPKVQRYLDAAFKNFKPGLKQNMASLKADAFGGINEDFIRLLYKSQKEVDRARHQYKELTASSLLNEFKDLDSLTQEEREAITRVLLKSDFSVLIATGEFNMQDSIKLLNDDAYLDEQLKKYANRLDIKNDNHLAVQTKSLAEWMMKGNQNNHNQFKNAFLIHETNKNKSKATVEEIDVYITLLAMKDHLEPRTKSQIKSVINREFSIDKDHNGITNTIYHHIAFKENALKDNFNNNPVLISKGYIADITNPNIQIEFAATDAETQKLMEEADYEFVSGFESITGVNNQNYGIYINRNLPDAMRTKGIASVTSKHFAGSSFKEIMSRNPATEGQINLLLKRFIDKQTKKQNTLDANHTMMPIVNEKGKIVDYTIHMNHAFKERLLEQELSFDQVLPTMYSHSLDKASSEKINREAIDLLDTHTTLNYDKEPQKYVNILEGENRDEYFNVLPRDARNHILDLAKTNKDKKLTFYVERKLLDTVFGYKMPSVGNAPIIRSNKKIQKYAKIAEKLMFELVALSKVNIVIKIPAVLGFNIVSNFMTSMIYGIPPTYLIKKWREGFKELERYQKEHEKLQLLELKQTGNPALRNDSKIENDKKILIKSLNDNKVAKLIDMGLFNSITEDINKNDFTYRHQSMNTLRNTKIGKKFDNKFKGKAVQLANQAYIGEETALFKTMMHLTQASDFIARYAMYSHATEVKNMDENKAFKQMVETFVNYDQPLNRYLQYGNDIGLLFFVKYWLRIQRATFNIVKEKPLNIGMLYVGNTMLGLDIESIMESSILTGNFFPTAGGPLKVIEEIVMLPGLEILSGESLGLG